MSEKDDRFTPARWQAIIDGAWAVEIGLDSAMCNDSGQADQVKADAERLLADATRLRRSLSLKFGSLAVAPPETTGERET